MRIPPRRLRPALAASLALALGACQVENRRDGSTVLRTPSLADLARGSSAPAAPPPGRPEAAAGGNQTIAGPLRLSADAVMVGPATVLRAPPGGWDMPPSVAGVSPSAAFPAVILLLFPGGSACPATYRLLDATVSPPFVTAEFGTCSDLARLASTERQVTVTMPLATGGTGAWRYTLGQAPGQRGTLTRLGQGRP
ncbi:hypothetical protein EAH89_19745 [Roseomonas nepalensis]|uniref:Lipoprotein n=1 Tax=Muricoccus nepalensis TaxID=1854500 RepID=A0A502FS33_9PROT|nr:hypothetical protein [Roseomonas nepalensis]TPG51833.1 hypothetical protein EAH89_19745 [Roseomonas nepalensis]